MPIPSSRCSSCSAPIIWVTMDSGKSMPVNPERVRVVLANRDFTGGHVITGYLPHWGTCPNADKHRHVKFRRGL